MSILLFYVVTSKGLSFLCFLLVELDTMLFMLCSMLSALYHYRHGYIVSLSKVGHYHYNQNYMKKKITLNICRRHGLQLVGPKTPCPKCEKSPQKTKECLHITASKTLYKNGEALVCEACGAVLRFTYDDGRVVMFPQGGSMTTVAPEHC